MDLLRHVFRSTTDEEIPLLKERLACLREAGQVLYEVRFTSLLFLSRQVRHTHTKTRYHPPVPQKYSCNFTNCIQSANGSAAALVNLLARDFSCFRDEFPFPASSSSTSSKPKTIRFLKRAQILVADLWACFRGQGHGAFRDIDKITMFADYRVPQVLSTLGCISYSPPLGSAIRERAVIKSGSKWEMQLRGTCVVWFFFFFSLLATPPPFLQRRRRRRKASSRN